MMRRVVSALVALTLLAITPVLNVGAAHATTTEEMNLDQTILVWNEETYADFSNYDIAMSTLSTITGEAAQVGYTFAPALDPGPCPAPYETSNYCGGPVKSAAMNPVTRQTYALQSGVDSPFSTVFTIDPQTAAASLAKTLSLPNGVNPFYVQGIFFDADETLYAWYSEANVSPTQRTVELFTVNLDNGAMSPAGTFPLVDFTPNTETSISALRSISVAPDGTVWAFSVSTDQGVAKTFAWNLDLAQTSASLITTLNNVIVQDSAFDANGYLWTVTTDDKLYSYDVAGGNAPTLRANVPNFSGGFVISDVPFPTTSGVTEGETFTLGQDFNLNIENARASSGYSVEIHSTPMELAAGTVAPAGSAQVPLVIPSSVTPGAHELVVSYLAPNGRTVTQTFPITVTGLAATGSNLETPSLVASGFLLLGTLSVLWAMRRRLSKN